MNTFAIRAGVRASQADSWVKLSQLSVLKTPSLFMSLTSISGFAKLLI